MKKEKAPIDHVISMMKNLKTAWEQIDNKQAVSGKPTESEIAEARKGGFVARG
jgi:flagellin-specific chaperone FliS